MKPGYTISHRLLGGVLFFWMALLSGQEDLPLTVYRDSLDQERLRQDLEKAKQSLAADADELRANGATVPELPELDQLVQALDGLSGQEMTRVVALLQAASQAPTGPPPPQLSSAFEEQKGRFSRLSPLVLQLYLRHLLVEVQGGLLDLTHRQMDNYRTTGALLAAGSATAPPGRADPANFQAGATEQTTLEKDLGVFLATLDKLKPDLEMADDKVKSCLAAVRNAGLKEMAAQASASINQGAYDQALKDQQALRDRLIDLSSQLLKAKDMKTLFHDSSELMDRLVNLQKNLLDHPEGRSIEVARDQAEVLDEVQLAERVLNPFNAQCAHRLGEAEDALEKSYQALVVHQAAEAVTHQQQAYQGILQAKQQLDQQLAALREFKTDLTPEQRLAQLQQITAGLQQALEQNKQLRTAERANALAPEQEARQEDRLAQQINQLQPQVLPFSPLAAEALGQALDQVSRPDASVAKDLQVVAQEVQKQMDQARQDAAMIQALATSGPVASSGPPATDQNPSNPSLDLATAVRQMQQQRLQTLAQNTGQINAPTTSGQAWETDLVPAGSLATEKGQGNDAPGMATSARTGLVVGGLTPKDREAISQLQKEKVPPEFAPMVNQYLKNIADDAH
jgi:hypothetical protein